MPDNVDKLFEIMQANGAANDRNKFRKVFLTPGNKGYKIRKDIYDGLRADGIIDSPTYEDFRRKLRLGGSPTVNKYRQQMFNSVDPNKSRASELTHRAVGQAVKGMNNVRKPVTAKVVDQKGKKTGEKFAITPAKTVEDLDREYAQETTKNWENELNDQMADADKDAAKISDLFKSFIGSTDEVGSVWGNITRGGGIAGTPHSVTTNNGILENTEARQILAAGDYNRKRRELLQLEKDSRNGAIFDNHSFFRGMYDAAKDTGLLTGGASDLINAGSLLATKQDLDKGVRTEAGDMLMQQVVKNSDAQSQYGDNQGWMYTGGVITTNMAPFMMQVASAGFSKGLSTSIGKVVQGAASKVALGTMKKAAGFASADLAKNIGKFTGLTTKAFGKAIQYGIVGAAQANTVGLGNVANDVINRYTGQVYQDEQGNYKFGTFDSDGKLVHEGGEDFLTAFVKGDAAQTIEFATELAGGGIDAVGTALKNFVSKGGKKIIEKYNMENVSKVINFLLNNKVSKNARYLKAGADRTLGKVELNSIVGESLEEELGIIANTVFTGDNKISDLWDEKQQSNIWGGMLLSIGLMKGSVAPFHAYNAKQYYSYKHKLDKADVNLSQLLGKEKWEELRNQIDATTNEDMPEMVNKINRDVALGKNRQPVREYIQNLLIMRGYDIGNMLAAKKAVEDKGEGVSVKNMEKNQAYQQGRDAYGYDNHEIQLDQEDKQKSLAQLLGISEQQLASMSDEELEALSGRDDNIDRAIYDYQLSTARYEGVIDNARDQIDLEVQRAAQAVDMYTDKSRNTIRNATIKATGGLEDYGVYIINGNIATHEDGSIDISNSDDMILYYDPTTNTVEHADATMFAELGSEENADEVRNQAMADAKEKAIKETTGIIDGVVEVGTQFKTVDADGTEHTYEVLDDNGDGTAVITIDGNIPTELVNGENVNVPLSFEELQKMKDESDQQRLQAAKAQREQMEKERAEQQMQAQTTKAENPAQEDNIHSAPIEDNLDYSDIIRDDGKVQMVDVSDKDGNNLFPDAKDVFYIQGNKMRTKFAYIDANGELKTQSFPTGLVKIKTRGEVSVDDYKKYRNMILSAEYSAMPESSMIEDNSGENRGEIEVESPTIEDETASPESAENTDTAAPADTSATEQTHAAPAITLEDGTIVPMLDDGNPDFSKLTAAQTAELYDTQFGEDAESVISSWVSDAKKALDKASNMNVKGKTFVEQKAAKDAKEKAIADAQSAYDSAVAIRDAYNERQLAKVEDTADGRKELIEKARRKFARLKSAVKDDAESVSQLYRDTIGSLLHRLYDSTGIDVTDTTPLTAEEYVASNLGAHSLNYEGTETSKGVKQETGLSREDFAKTQLLAADGKGTTIDALVHSLWENRPSNLESLDTQDIRNALIGVLNSGFKASEARNFVENIRIAQAENILEEQKRAQENAAYAEQHKAEPESELQAKSNEKAELQEKSEAKLDNESSNESNDLDNDLYNEETNDKINDNINAPEVPEDATDENPLGLQLSEDKVPFEIEGGKSGETYDINDNEDRQRLINDNKVDDKDILDIDMPKHVHKAIKELCKKMGLKVQFLYMGARSNGWIENGTMYLALDTEKATQFVFGHEMTHAIKQKNPDAYKELVKVAMSVTTRKKFEEDFAKVYQNYHGISGYNNVDDYVEEVVADNLGKFINDFDLAQKFSIRLNHPVLATILHAIQKIKSLLYGDFYKSVDALERIVEKAYVETAKGEVTNSETGEDVSFSLRQKPEPKKKGVGYKVFVLKDGKLYPPMVANPDGAATPVGVWLDADAAPIAGESKTGRPQVKQGGKGTQSGSGKLAYRPGWHLGVVPYAIQFNRKDADGNKTLFPKNFVFAEVEYAADVDYQEEARQEGINPSGKYQHSLAGLKHLPTDGFYMYRTNPNPETDPWVITGAMKVNRILTRAEQAELVKNAGREPQQIQEGDIVTDDIVNSINQEIADAPKFSLKVYHGSGADFTEFDFDHMGEGAGSQVFGWGGYVTSSEEIGKSYATLSRNYGSRNIYNGDIPLTKLEKAALSSFIENNNNHEGTFKEGVAGSIERQKALIAKYPNNPLSNRIKKRIEVLEGVMPKLDSISWDDFVPSGKNLYEVDIPEDNGSNYLEWEKKPSDEVATKIIEGLYGLDAKTLDDMASKDIVFRTLLYDYIKNADKGQMIPILVKTHALTRGTTYDNGKVEDNIRFVYNRLSRWMGSPKAASQFLSSLGFTGIKYPAGTIMGGAEENDTNYVIFKPEDMKITQHTKFSLRLKSAIEETETNPSDAQKESGNYKKGHIKFGGYDYTIENPKGSTRSGKDADGKEWKVTMHDTYGYIRGKFGKDGDHLDMFINDKADLDNWNGDVFVVDQVNSDGSFDEHKVMYGYDSMDDAKKAYLANYSKGWKGLGNITGVSKAEFDKWLDTSNRKLKPFSDYAKVKFSQAQSVNNDEPKTFEEFLNHPSLKFSIKNEQQRKAAEDAYEYASKLRPNKSSQYALVDMSNPSNSPEYYEKKVLADRWRRFYNKAVHNELDDVYKDAWGNYKLFDLDRPFAEQVNEVKGDVPDEFNAPDVVANKNADNESGAEYHEYKQDEPSSITYKDRYKAFKQREANREKTAELRKERKEVEDSYNSKSKERIEYNKQLMKEYMDKHALSSENDIPDDVWEDLRSKSFEKYKDELDSLFNKYKDLDKQIKAVAEPRFSLKEEKEKIVADAKANGTYMTAPNGEKTKLDAEQWATVRTTNFKNWFGDWENDPENASKVVDENGEPMVVWHGRSAEFNTFEKKEGVRFIMGIEDKVKAEGFFFSPDKGLAEEFASNSSRHRGGKANVVPFFLNIRKPMNLTGEDYDRIYEDVTGWEYMFGMDTQDNLWGIMDEEGMADKIKDKGYDGAIFVEELDDSYEPTKISYCALDSNQIKSAENNNGDFSADNNDIRFSLAGERGAAAADKAEERTTRMDFLSVARKMEEEKKDAKAIKIATGWERGADGKWRYEMPDAKIKLGQKVTDNIYGEDGKVIWYDNERTNPIGTLKDLLDAPELFKAYPELKNIKVAILNANQYRGAYSEEDKTIFTNITNFDSDFNGDRYLSKDVERNLVHEIQHIIQTIEGFGKGGNSGSVRGEIKKKFDEVTKQIRQLKSEGKNEEAKALIEKNKALYNANVNEKDDYKNYLSLAGEVEARNVSARLNMTPEERRKSLAESTEDVARKDQIFLGVGDVSFSLRDMADGKESGAADMAEDLKSLNTPDEVDDAIKTAIDDMPSGWKMANKKIIHIAQALGENRKSEIAGEEPKFSIRTYHGTGAKFDKFDLSHALEGEGSETFGHGVYVTNSKEIGGEYAKRGKENKISEWLSNDKNIPNKYRNNENVLDDYKHIAREIAYGKSLDELKAEAERSYKEETDNIKQKINVWEHGEENPRSYEIYFYQNDLEDTPENREKYRKETIDGYKEDLQLYDNMINAVRGMKEEDFSNVPRGFRYDVDIPDDNGSNYMDWEGTIPDSLDKKKVEEDAYKVVSDNQGFNDFKATPLNGFIAHTLKTYVDTTDVFASVEKLKSDIKDVIEDDLADDDVLALNEYLKDATTDDVLATIWYNDLVRDIDNAETGEELYRKLSTYVGDNEASKILSDNGLVGIKYPAGTIYGGAKKGDYNYVIFDENNANIVGNTKFSLRGSTSYDKQMEEWMEKNHLENGAVPMEKPIMKEGENIFDYANRMVEWTRNQNLWKTAPKQTGFQDALDKWKDDNGLSPDAYPPVRPHRENYSTEIGYEEDLEEYNKKKELWKSAPKPKDFDLSVDLEDMNKQLRNIRRAVMNQKKYDQRTVKAVSDLVRKMLNIGWGDGLSRGKVGNLLSAAKNATGANDVKKYLDKAMGILAENYLNRLSTAYDNLINTKGARADQSGVIKMGSLDAKGQAFMSEYKKAINMDDSSLNTYIANIEEDSAKNEDNVEMNDYRLAGIQASIMYKQQIGGNDADISELKRQIGELKNKKDFTKEDKDLLKSLEKKLFENKFDRITMYENLLNNIQRMVKESKGRAKEFRDDIAEHKNEILHRANLDLEGVDSTYYDTTTAKKKFVNNVFQRAAFSSTYTFEQFLKFFGKKSANGEGYLYNYFTKLNQDALDEEQLYNEMNRNALDEKTKELFGNDKFMKLVGIDGKGMKEMDIEVTDYSNKKTGKRTIHLKQGQMLYIYLVNKETDGEMKLRAMGITEEDVAAIEENLDTRVKAMGEWLQDEYLPECQRRYQATHTKYFGAPMKEVENYFPLAINNRARNVKEDVNQDSDAMSQLAGTSTGAIVTRRVNVIPLDIENADAFEVAFNHLQEMEEWSAMLPFRQDINTLLSYTHFRNQVQNMSSVAYGSGKTLWDEFKQTAQIAAGTYKPKVNAGMMDSRIAAAMGGIAVAKISGRLWTAIKQSQSATVFLPECDFTRFVKNGVNPYGSWKWAKENIPDFRKRIEKITYGDVKLRQYLDELEKYHDWTKVISKWGMAPNMLVDGITCAVGARSVYETEVNRLTKLGYPKEKAEEKAYYKAVAAYNKTQQSSGGMYLSPMQVDRTYVSAALSLFKNANYAYGRMQIEACRGLARTYDLWGGKHKTTLIESMTRQIMKEDGLDENTARAIAKATYNRTFRQSIGRLINFATLVPVTWALYKVLPYLLTGDDDDKKKDMIEEAVLKGFATSLSDNYVIPFASNILNAGLKVEDGKPTFDPEVFKWQNLYINPATSDLANIYSMIGNQKWYSVANKLGMLGVQMLVGFNPETVGALYQAFAEADYDNGNTAKEWQIGILKAISAPEESIRELYMDELGLKSGDKDAMKKFMSLAGLDADDINKVPLAELEKRYAERQINRDNLLSQIVMDAETFNGYVDKYQKSFEKKIKDKMDKWDEYDKKKVDEFFDTTSDPKLKDMIEKKRTKDANAAADEQISKEGLNQDKNGKEPSEEAYDAVKMSIDVAEDNAISTYNKVLNKRYAAMNDEYNNQTDAMKYIFMSKHPNFKEYKDLESEYTTYGKKIKGLKEKLVSADGYDAKQTILKQIRSEREKFSELQSKVR